MRVCKRYACVQPDEIDANDVTTDLDPEFEASEPSWEEALASVGRENVVMADGRSIGEKAAEEQ